MAEERKSSQEWFWTPEWQAAEREAEADIESGRVYDFDSVDEALAALKLPEIVDTIADEPDSMQGEYPEVLHEGRL